MLLQRKVTYGIIRSGAAAVARRPAGSHLKVDCVLLPSAPLSWPQQATSPSYLNTREARKAVPEGNGAGTLLMRRCGAGCCCAGAVAVCGWQLQVPPCAGTSSQLQGLMQFGPGYGTDTPRCLVPGPEPGAAAAGQPEEDQRLFWAPKPQAQHLKPTSSPGRCITCKEGAI